MTNPSPSQLRGDLRSQRAIGAGLKQRFQDTSTQPPPVDLMQLLEKADRRAVLAPKA